jgi:serralysin
MSTQVALTFSVLSLQFQFSLTLTLGDTQTQNNDGYWGWPVTNVTGTMTESGQAPVTVGPSSGVSIADNLFYGVNGIPQLNSGYLDFYGIEFQTASDAYNVWFDSGTYLIWDYNGVFSGTGDVVNDFSCIPCFCSGTMIEAENGAIAVEDLRIGDRVKTASGEIKPVVWIGRRAVSTRFADPVRFLPIRVKANALGDNIPCRDLLVSPDHALLIGAVLIHAGALINGTSIVRETKVPDTFVYYHLELDDHSLILAENAPAETFVDDVDRMGFDNWAEHAALFPAGKPISELPYARAKSHRQVPAKIRCELDRRAEALGSLESAAA